MVKMQIQLHMLIAYCILYLETPRIETLLDWLAVRKYKSL